MKAENKLEQSLVPTISELVMPLFGLKEYASRTQNIVSDVTLERKRDSYAMLVAYSNIAMVAANCLVLNAYFQ